MYRRDRSIRNDAEETDPPGIVNLLLYPLCFTGNCCDHSDVRRAKLIQLLYNAEKYHSAVWFCYYGNIHGDLLFILCDDVLCVQKKHPAVDHCYADAVQADLVFYQF